MASVSPVLALLPGGTEVWIIILAIVVLIWGPSKLPGLARSLGMAKKEFKKASQEAEEEANKPASADQKKTAEAEKAGTTGHGPN